jgi:hypothetical protein
MAFMWEIGSRTGKPARLAGFCEAARTLARRRVIRGRYDEPLSWFGVVLYGQGFFGIGYPTDAKDEFMEDGAEVRRKTRRCSCLTVAPATRIMNMRVTRYGKIAHPITSRGMTMNIWIFECNLETEWECHQRNLFGSNVQWPLHVKGGDLCFLFNYGTHPRVVYGIYRAVSDGARNIDRSAWSGRSPYQARVTLDSKGRLAVPIGKLERLISTDVDGRPKVRHQISGNAAQELIDLYAGRYHRDLELGQRNKFSEEDFRLRHPCNFHCTDGHHVRSQSEQTICNWLSQNRVFHEYERIPNMPDQLIPDFTVYTLDKNPVFIEFWGCLDDPVYQQRRQRKCEAYLRHRCRLIELYPDHLKNLDFVLRRELRKFGVSFF